MYKTFRLYVNSYKHGDGAKPDVMYEKFNIVGICTRKSCRETKDKIV